MFAGVFLAHALSPVATSGDSRWVVMVALSMIHHGDTNLDEYLPIIRQQPDYAVECVDAAGSARKSVATLSCPQGHIYNFYPIGVPVASIPVVAAVEAGAKLARPVMPIQWLASNHPLLGLFFEGDLAQAHAIVEVIAGSIFIALAAAIMYLTALAFLSARHALFLALIFAFATPAWSTGSRSLYQHGPSMAAIAAVIYLLVRARNNGAIAQYASLPAACAYALRPTNSLLVLMATIYVFACHRRWFPRFLLWALPVALPFLWYDWSTYHSLLSTYYRDAPQFPHDTAGMGRFAMSLAAQTLSPSRGLFTFTPIFLFSVWGMWIAHRKSWAVPLSRYLVGLAVAHWIVISCWANWWAGHSYGPRFFSDMTPVFVFFLIPVLARWGALTRTAAVAFVGALAFSVFVHARGGVDFRAHRWNTEPVSVDDRPARAWDWSDPQFFHGLFP